VLAFEAELAHFPRSLISALWEAAPPEIDHQLVSELLGEVTHWWQGRSQRLPGWAHCVCSLEGC
jgi:hypothetical protein